MQVTCPNCQSTFPAGSGNTQTCPACMHSFDSSPEDGPPELMKLEIQGASGEALGSFDLYALRQMIYAGEVSGKELIRSPGEGWEPIYERPELISMFELVGVDVVSIRLASQKIQGWRKSDSAEKAAREKKAASQTRTRELELPSMNKAKPLVDAKMLKLVGLGGLLFFLLLWFFLP